MGRKPLIGLVGLCLAGAALCGCQNDSNHRWNGRSTVPPGPTPSPTAGTPTSGLSGTGTPTTGAWNNTPSRSLTTQPMGSPDLTGRTMSSQPIGSPELTSRPALGTGQPSGTFDPSAGTRQPTSPVGGTTTSSMSDPMGSSSFTRASATSTARPLDDPAVHSVNPPDKTSSAPDIQPPPPPLGAGTPSRGAGFPSASSPPPPPPMSGRPAGPSGMGQGADSSLAPPPPMNTTLPQADTTAKYQRSTDMAPLSPPPSPVPTMKGNNGFDQ